MGGRAGVVVDGLFSYKNVKFIGFSEGSMLGDFYVPKATPPSPKLMYECMSTGN